MNTNTFALSSSSPTHHGPGQKRSAALGGYGSSVGMDGAAALKMRRCLLANQLIPGTVPASKKMSKQYKNLKFHQRPFLYLSTRLLALLQRAFQKEEKIDEFESMLSEFVGFQLGREAIYRRQQELDVLCKKTSFTRQEIKLLYWGWKVACPDGVLDERTFKEIYAQFFPQAGDSSLYAHYVFNAMFGEMLNKNNGQITFCDYACALSALCRGSIAEKIKWIFTLYDINKDGRITYDEVLQISIAIYALLGFHVAPSHNSQTYEKHAKRVFAKLDKKSMGYITFEQFQECCLQDEAIIKSMEQLDTGSI